MRWLVICVLTVATAGMFVVSMRANYLYGYGIGQSEETKRAIAWANVGADVWKGFGLIVVVTLWRNAWRRASVAVSLTWLVCLVFSVSSAIGIYVQERTALTSGREARHASYADAVKELAEIEGRSKTLGAHRPAAQVEATIAGVFARPVTIGNRVRGTVAALSDHCVRNESRTAADCVEVAALRAELAVAVEALRLEERAARLRQQVVALRERGGSAAPDPVGEFWAWITRGSLSVKDVGFGLPVAFALMIEMVSAFGPLGIASYAEATRSVTERDASRQVAPERVVARSVATGRDGRVVQYMAERTEPTSTPTAVGVEQLYSDYEVWCLSNTQRPVSQQEFIDEFDRVRQSPQLAGKIKKFGTRYFGIAFVAHLPLAAINAKKRTS
jgi:hypothetical protein